MNSESSPTPSASRCSRGYPSAMSAFPRPKPSGRPDTPTNAPESRDPQPAASGWTARTLVAWLGLALLRGTTSTMVALAGDSIAPSLVVLLRTPGALLLFALLIAYWYRSDVDYRDDLKAVASSPISYAKFCFVGVFQSGGPFLLITYGVRYLPPEFAGVFLAMTPVWAMFNEQTIFRLILKKRPPINRCHVLAITLIVAGVVTFLMPVFLSLASPDAMTRLECSSIIDAGNGTARNDSVPTLSAKQRRRDCATIPQALISLFCLLLSSFLFGFVAVLWRNYRGRIHFSVVGFGQIFTAGVFVAVVWAILEDGKADPDWNPGSISALAYLSICSAFGTNCLLYYLISTIGAVPASRSMTLVPIVSWAQGRIFFTRDSSTIGQEIGGLICFLFGLILFEGRVDRICGIRMPWSKRLASPDNGTVQEVKYMVARSASTHTHASIDLQADGSAVYLRDSNV